MRLDTLTGLLVGDGRSLISALVELLVRAFVAVLVAGPISNVIS